MQIDCISTQLYVVDVTFFCQNLQPVVDKGIRCIMSPLGLSVFVPPRNCLSIGTKLKLVNRLQKELRWSP